MDWVQTLHTEGMDLNPRTTLSPKLGVSSEQCWVWSQNQCQLAACLIHYTMSWSNLDQVLKIFSSLLLTLESSFSFTSTLSSNPPPHSPFIHAFLYFPLEIWQCQSLGGGRTDLEMVSRSQGLHACWVLLHVPSLESSAEMLEAGWRQEDPSLDWDHFVLVTSAHGCPVPVGRTGGSSVWGWASELSLQFVRCAYVIILMAIYWCTEVIPLAVTSLLPALLFPLFKILDSKQVSTWGPCPSASLTGNVSKPISELPGLGREQSSPDWGMETIHCTVSTHF